MPILEPVILPATLWVVLGSIGLLQVLLLVGQVRQGRRLRQLESSQPKPDPEPLPDLPQMEALEARQAEVHESKRHFQEFLDEDPARKEMSKKEQFAEFRKWRAENGLNWVSISESGGSPSKNS